MMSVSSEWFFYMELLVDYVLMLLGVVVWEYKTIFNINHFINSKITALAMYLQYVSGANIHIYTRTSSWLLPSVVKCTHTHAHAWSRARLAHTFRGVGLRGEKIRHIHTRAHTHAWLPAQIHVHLVALFSLTIIGFSQMQRYTQVVYFFHQCGRVFSVETVVLQTALWDIWYWRSHFLVFKIEVENKGKCKKINRKKVGL